MLWKQFHTDTKGNEKPLDAWRRFVSESLIGVQCEVAPSIDFRASFQQLLVNGLSISYIRSSPHFVSRSQKLASKSNSDDFLVLLQRQGRVRIKHRGANVRVHPGNAFVFDPNYSHEMEFDTAIEQVMFSVSKTKLLQSEVDPQYLSQQEIPCDHRRVRCVDNVVMALTEGGNAINSLHAYKMLDVATDIMVEHLKDTLHLYDPNVISESQKLRLQQVKTYIDQNLTRADLSVAEVANYFDLSRRYVDKLFEAECTTASKWISQARVSHAAARLTDNQHHKDRVSTIAFDLGFNDLSYFNRLFKQKYGMSPTQFRQSTSTPY